MATPTSSLSVSPAWRRQRELGRAGVAMTAGATAVQWKPKEYPPPKCAQGRPEHLKDWRKHSKILRHTLKMEEFDFHDRHGTGGDVEGLRAFLRHKFGNAARGWRTMIAPHADPEAHDYGRAGAKVTLFSDFCAGLKKIGFSGNGKTVWNYLSKGTNKAWLEDLDPTLGESLDAVAGAIADNYAGGTQQAWHDIEREHAGRVTADEFDQFLYDRDLLSGPAKVRQVFECLAISGRGTLTLEEFRYLDHWAARRLGHPLVPEVKRVKQEPVPWSPPPPQPERIPNLKDFRKFLEQKFGSPARGWRVALDVKAAGHISPSEFGMACRQMGWHHPHSQLWNELVREGGGVAGLRGLDPETCHAIDTLVERMLPSFGDFQTLWTEIVDPDGDGICSRAEWVKHISKEIGLSGKAAGLVFTVMDTMHTGWVAFTELSFLEDFMPVAGHDEDWNQTDIDGRKSLFSSLSTGLLPAASGARQGDGPFTSTDFSWASSSLEASRRSGMSSMPSLHLGSTQRSSRAMQNRQYQNCHMAKYRWMGEAAAAHTRSMSEGSAWRTLKKEVAPKMPTVGGTALSDVFRHTSEFYREGVRRLQYHHEQQAASIDKRRSPDSQSPASSSHRSPTSNARSNYSGR